MRRWILLGLVMAVPIVFLADRVNRRQVHMILLNASLGKPPMQHVAFVFPLIPHPTPSPTPVPVYPDPITYGDGVQLRYEELGGGYWQTASFDMVRGAPLSRQDDWQGQFRFKYNPPSDPMHPGASVVAIAGSRNTMRFANLGKRDFYGVKSLGAVRWLIPSTEETPAVWNLQAGDVVAMRIETDLSIPIPDATSSATGSAAAPPRKPIKIQKLTYAKLLITELSQDTVSFDYVYRFDGSDRFPRPHE